MEYFFKHNSSLFTEIISNHSYQLAIIKFFNLFYFYFVKNTLRLQHSCFFVTLTFIKIFRFVNMTFSTIREANPSFSIASQQPASVPLAHSNSSFCSKINRLILKIVAAVRNFFSWILSCWATQKQNPILSVSDISEEIHSFDLESSEDQDETGDAVDSDSEELSVSNQAEDFSGMKIENPTSSKPEKSTPLFKNGMKIISKNGNQILSKITGVKTEYAVPAMSYLVHSVDAAKKGKYKLAAAAGLSSISATMLMGMNLVIPKELRELNKLTTYDRD